MLDLCENVSPFTLECYSLLLPFPLTFSQRLHSTTPDRHSYLTPSP